VALLRELARDKDKEVKEAAQRGLKEISDAGSD
jgi:hypothetical protein